MGVRNGKLINQHGSFAAGTHVSIFRNRGFSISNHANFINKFSPISDFDGVIFTPRELSGYDGSLTPVERNESPAYTLVRLKRFFESELE